MIKRLTALCIAFLLTITTCGMAFASEGAGADVELARFEKYAGYTFDKNTGLWSVTGNETALAMSLIDRNAANYTDSIVYFYLELTGDINTGSVVPVLNIVYVDADVLLPTTASFVSGGVRYDFAVTPVTTTLGNENAEIMRIALDRDALSAVRAIAGSEKTLVKLGGGALKCEVTCERLDSYRNAFARIHGLALTGLSAMLDELDQMGFDGYDLYDLNMSAWLAAGGAKTEYQIVTLSPASERAADLDEDYEMLSAGDTGRAVTDLQNRLIELGYLYMTNASSTYAESTTRAVRNAQRYYGMLPTGNADLAFVEKLYGDDQTPAAYIAPTAEAAEATDATAGAQAQLGQAYFVEDKGRLTVNRYWFARKVTSLGEDGLVAERAVSNTDHILLVVDGTFASLSRESASLFSALTATVEYGDGYAYECLAVCEADGGSRFDTTLLPLDETRVVLYAEVPAALEGQVFTLTVHMGESTLTYPIG